MSRFVLQPCKIREDRIVPVPLPPLELDTKGLLAKFAPSRAPGELLKLRSIRIEGFLGRTKSAKSDKEQIFFLWNVDRTNHLDFVLKADPDFPARVLEVYCVKVVDWGSHFEELESGKKDLLPGSNVRRKPALRESP